MSATSLLATHELSCPNCGAPATMPTFGNLIQCEYCGTRFILPHAQSIAAPVLMNTMDSPAPTLSPETQASVKRWVKWIVVLLIVVTVVPTLCGLLASVCGVFGAFVPFFAR